MATILTPAFKDDFEEGNFLASHLKGLIAVNNPRDESSEEEEDFFEQRKKVKTGPAELVKKYLSDKRRDGKILNDYPMLKALHLKHCTKQCQIIVLYCRVAVDSTPTFAPGCSALRHFYLLLEEVLRREELQHGPLPSQSQQARPMAFKQWTLSYQPARTDKDSV